MVISGWWVAAWGTLVHAGWYCAASAADMDSCGVSVDRLRHAVLRCAAGRYIARYAHHKRMHAHQGTVVFHQRT